MDIVHSEIDRYMHSITPKRDPVLEEMEEYAAEHDFPIVGPLVGRILFQYAKLLRPKRILELGSGYGYSALWWARGCEDASIICTEGSQENIKKAEYFLTKAGVWNRIEYLLGNALATIEHLQGDFDLIFMDIDKTGYPEGFAKGFPRLKKGGMFVTDNVLWSGKVTGSNPDESTSAIQKYNRTIYSTEGAYSSVLPVRDGVAVTLKL